MVLVLGSGLGLEVALVTASFASACAWASVCETEAFITTARDMRPRLARARRDEVSDL